MSRPTEEELDKALNAAKHMRESGQDPDFIAKSLLNLNYRAGYLEAVVRAVERFLRSGMAEHEHTLLVKAIDRARHSDEKTSSGEHTDIGLS